MKVNVLEAHDRLKHIKKNGDSIGKCCQDLIDQRPFGDRPFYIFAHKRTIELDERMEMSNKDFWLSITNPNYSSKYKTLEEVPTHRVIWQPRLLRPMPQENSMLFKVYPGTDLIKPIWIIPEKCMWAQYEKGKVTADNFIMQCIDAFQNRRRELETPEPDDPTEEQAKKIYKEVARSAKRAKLKRFAVSYADSLLLPPGYL